MLNDKILYKIIMSTIGLFIFIYDGFALENNDKVLSLKDCISIGLKNNITIARAKLTVEKYTALLDKSKSYNLPKLYFNSSVDHFNNSNRILPAERPGDPGYYTNDVFNSRLQLKYTLYNGNKIGNEIKIAKINENITSNKLINTKESIKLEISKLYFSILKVNKMIETYKVWTNALNEQKNSTELLVKVGKKTELDLLKIKVRQEGVEQKIIDFNVMLKNLYTELANTMNVKENNFKIKEINVDDDINPVLNFDEIFNIALTNNRDFLILNQEKEKSDKSLNIAESQRKPAIYLNSSAGYKSALTEEIKQEGSKSGDKYWNAGITIDFPVFTGYEITAKIKEAKINQNIAEKNIELFKQKLKLNITTTINKINSLNKNIEKSKILIQAAEKSLKFEKEKFNVGKSDITNVLIEEAAYRNAVASFYSYLYDRKIAFIILKYLKGEI